MNCSVPSGAPGGAGARSVIVAIFKFGPSKWVVTRERSYGGAFIAAERPGFADDGTAPVLGCQIKH